jgi:hypothetical protein
MIIAYCERCTGVWRVRRNADPMLLEGICMNCQEESEVAERPLAFGLLFGDVEVPEELPEGWIAE